MEDGGGKPETVEAGEPDRREVDGRGREVVGKLHSFQKGWGAAVEERTRTKRQEDSAEANDADGQENGILN